MVIMSLALKKFDLSTVPKHFVMLAIGRRRSGKTTAILSLMKAFKNRYDFAVVFCGSLATCEEYQRVVPPSFVHKEWDVKLVESMVARQERKRESKQKVEDILLVMDDLAFNPSIFKSKVMKRLFYNGRHVHIGLVFTLQYIMDLDTSFRTNVDVCICLREQIQANRERYYKYFFGQFPTQRAFNMALDACTENYGALVTANNLTISNEINQSVFWMRAPREVPDSRLGNPMLWAMDEQAYEDTEFKEDQTGKTVRRVEPVP